MTDELGAHEVKELVQRMAKLVAALQEIMDAQTLQHVRLIANAALAATGTPAYSESGQPFLRPDGSPWMESEIEANDDTTPDDRLKAERDAVLLVVKSGDWHLPDAWYGKLDAALDALIAKAMALGEEPLVAALEAMPCTGETRGTSGDCHNGLTGALFDTACQRCAAAAIAAAQGGRMTTATQTHTPGPWSVAGESGNPNESEIIEGAERTIAWTCNTYDADKDEERITAEDRANARLIAAAPDLLAALEALTATAPFRNVPKDEQEWTSLDDEALESAFAAIAAAKGDA